MLQGQKVAPQALRHRLGIEVAGADMIQHHLSVLQPFQEESLLALQGDQDKCGWFWEDVAQVGGSNLINKFHMPIIKTLGCVMLGWNCWWVDAGYGVFKFVSSTSRSPWVFYPQLFGVATVLKAVSYCKRGKE